MRTVRRCGRYLIMAVVCLLVLLGCLVCMPLVIMSQFIADRLGPGSRVCGYIPLTVGGVYGLSRIRLQPLRVLICRYGPISVCNCLVRPSEAVFSIAVLCWSISGEPHVQDVWVAGTKKICDLSHSGCCGCYFDPNGV